MNQSSKKLNFPIIFPSVSTFPSISIFLFNASPASFNQIFFFPLTTKNTHTRRYSPPSVSVCVCVCATWGLGVEQRVGWSECVYSCFIGSEVHYSPNPQRSTHIWFCLWQEGPDTRTCTCIHTHTHTHIKPHTYARTNINSHTRAASFSWHWNQMAGWTQNLQAGWNSVLSKQ